MNYKNSLRKCFIYVGWDKCVKRRIYPVFFVLLATLIRRVEVKMV